MSRENQRACDGSSTPGRPKAKAPQQTPRSSEIELTPDLAEFRRRLDAKLAALPTRPLMPVKPEEKTAIRPGLAALLRRWPVPLPAALSVALTIGIVVGAGGAWWLSPGRAPTVAAGLSPAVQSERPEIEALSRDLQAAWQQLRAQAEALADQAGLQAESQDLKQRLDQAEELSAVYERLLTQQQDRNSLLEETLAAERAMAAASDETLRTREIDGLRHEFEQAQERIADQERSLTQERGRSRDLENELDGQRTATAAALSDKTRQGNEIGALRRALEQAEARAADDQQLIAQERGRGDAAREAAAREAAAREAAAREAAAREAAAREAAAREAAAREAAARAAMPEAAATTGPVAVSLAPATRGPSRDVSRLMTRARALLAQGDIAAARIVLERAAESGDPPALFALAETLDPGVLSSWGALGTQGEPARAHELYARAFAGGVLAAGEALARGQPARETSSWKLAE